MIVEGIVQGHRDGYGLVVSEQGAQDVYLPPQQMRAVMHLDRVRVKIVRQDKRGRPEGQVIEILERSSRPVIGRLLQEGGVWLLAPEDKRYAQDILIPTNALGGAKAGQVVSVEIAEPASPYAQPIGKVTEILGALHDPGMEIEIAVRKYGVPHRFSAEAERQAAALPGHVLDKDREGRYDLTDVPLVTIDGEDARDFDDAVYCEPARIGRENGFRLIVAIADVSHYVKPGDPLDFDALERATSVYFPRRVIPMLPEKLSNGLCSLNPKVERLCMVCDMLINAEGELKAYQFYPAVMRSHARFTYTEVAAILENTRGPEALANAELVPHLLHLYDVYSALLKARRERGAIDLEVPETQIVCDASGRIEKIALRTRNEAHRLIEECMLVANVSAADFLERSKHPGLYRVHEGPTPEKLALLRGFLKTLGIAVHLGDDPEPSDYQQLSDAARDRPDATQINALMLRSMQQAIYTPHNSGHFGLAYAAYSHFTSPIRRYPDLLTHRAIKAILEGGRYKLQPPEKLVLSLPSVQAQSKAAQAKLRVGGEAPPKPRKAVSADLSVWEAVGQHCSANERRADEATRDVESWLKCWYMRDKLGEEFVGSITAVTSFGIFVQLTTLFVEGLIHISELGAEYFRFDEARNELRGERTGRRYGLGERVLVQVSRVDLDGRKIDFRLVSDTLVAQAASPTGPGSRRRARAETVLAPLDVALDDSDGSLFELPADAVDRAASKPKRARASAGAKSRAPAGAGKTLARQVAKSGSSSSSPSALKGAGRNSAGRATATGKSTASKKRSRSK
ncbi:ribonuclease R [Thiomonas delicata]|uniref:Ribonuclease R n=1 Tax=Thiomonas delicata TaxID=364030 RepID=A0A238D8P1_THIDL|nr:Ribonuclease R [Thiomonas delicata]